MKKLKHLKLWVGNESIEKEIDTYLEVEEQKDSYRNPEKGTIHLSHIFSQMNIPIIEKGNLSADHLSRGLDNEILVEMYTLSDNVDAMFDKMKKRLLREIERLEEKLIEVKKTIEDEE